MMGFVSLAGSLFFRLLFLKILAYLTQLCYCIGKHKQYIALVATANFMGEDVL